MNIFDLYTEGRKGTFENFDLYKVSGPDREKYLQGQTTNDIASLSVNSFHLNSRIDRGGKVQTFFLLLKKEDSLFILIDREISNESIDELSKFIIMDDLEISKLPNIVSFEIGRKSENSSNDSFNSFLFGLPAAIFLEGKDSCYKELTREEKDFLCCYSGWPVLNEDVFLGQLINETRLDALAVSYTKGCFLGQETVSKIHHGRGASYVPLRMLGSELSIGDFKIQGRKGGKVLRFAKDITSLSVFREFRIENKDFILEQDDLKVTSRFENYLDQFSIEEFSNQLYHEAIREFHNGHEDKSIEIFNAVIDLSPTFADAYESLGVIYGRQDKFEKGIELMDQLLSVDESSVMAHTNKSLFLMKLGKIEEAEEEKGHATFKSFAMFGKEAEAKRDAQKIKEEKEEQMKQRESMFKQVLEIDPVDTIANFGMGDIYFYRNEYDLAKEHLETVLSEDSKYSTAYLLLGKVLEMKNDPSQAKAVYEKGIEVASAKGELMPANEMQARLVKL